MPSEIGKAALFSARVRVDLTLADAIDCLDGQGVSFFDESQDFFTPGAGSMSAVSVPRLQVLLKLRQPRPE